MRSHAFKIDTRQFVVVALSIAVALALPARAHGVRKFVNGRWFDGARCVARPALWSVDGVFRERHEGPADEVVDLKGGCAIPPFAEGHTHDFTVPDPDLSARYLERGVFYAKNTNSLTTLTAKVRPLVNRAETVDVAWALGGLTSSGGHPLQIYRHAAPRLGLTEAQLDGEAYWTIDTKEDLARRWSAIRAHKPDFIKVYLEHSEEHARRKGDDAFFGRRGLDPKLVPEVVALAHGAGLRVVAHIATAADFRAAALGGVDEIAHLPLEKLTPADAQLVARRGTFTTTTTLSHRPSEGVADLDGLHRHNLALLRDAGAKVALGTDGGQSVVDELENVRRLKAFDDAALLRIATRETPKTIFPARKLGVLADGFEASFLVLAGDPLADFANVRRISLRVKQGHVLKPPKAPVVERLVGEAKGHGAPAAIAEYRRLRREEPDRWDLGERQLNAVGYALLKAGRAADAIAIFRLNAEQSPGSSNAHDSLGEALLAAGQKAEALRSYQRAVELDGHNQGARDAIERLQR